MDKRNETLIRVLAAVDALWTPDRQPMNRRRHAAIGERRRDFAGLGVALVPRANEANDPQAQAATRAALAELQRDGLIVVRHPKWTATPFVKLSNRGDHIARALAGSPGLDMGHLAMLARHADHPIGCDGDGPAYTRDGRYVAPGVWHPELAMAQALKSNPVTAGQPSHVLCATVAEMFLPALSRGLVVSASDAAGDIFYALTAAGAAALENPPKVPRSMPAPCAAAGNHHGWFFELEACRLDAAEPRCPGEQGEPLLVPLARPGAAEAWAELEGEG